jgi:ABC-type transport system substrate-binding protein
MEIVAAYFEAIGLKVKIVLMDKSTQLTMHRAGKDAGFIFPWREVNKVSWAGRHLTKFVPGGDPVIFSSDELTDLISRYESELNLEKRAALLGKIRDFRYSNMVDIPLVLVTPVYAFRNKVVGEWPTSAVDKNHNFEYIRHVKPLNTWRLFKL